MNAPALSSHTDDVKGMPPLTPSDCDLSDFPRMMVDIPRLRGSNFDAMADDAAWRAGFNLWLTAWHQVPAASLDDDEATLTKAAGLGRDVKTWRKVRPSALKGWVKCDDGRLYHETIAEIALEAWLSKLGQRLSSGAGNAKKYGRVFDAAPILKDIRLAAALLILLNPKSEALGRQHVHRALTEVPPGANNLPPGAPERPAGSPVGSQGKGREGKDSSEDKSSANGLIEIDPDKDAWTGSVKVLRARGDMTEAAARKFFGGLLAANGITARDMLPAVGSAMVNSTGDPRAYFTKAAQGVKNRRPGAPQKRVGFV